MRAPAPRLPRNARRSRRLRDHDGVAAIEPGASVARDLEGVDIRIRRTRYHVHAEPVRGFPRPRSSRGRARRRERARLRPLPRRSEASSTRGRGGLRPFRKRLDPRQPADAGNEISQCVRDRRHCKHGDAEGRRIRRGRRESGRSRRWWRKFADRATARSTVARDRVTSNSAAGESAASMSTFSPDPSRPANITSLRWRCGRTRNASARAGARAGSDFDRASALTRLEAGAAE